MSEPTRPEIGSIGWIDLTSPDAEVTRDFYAAVVGWKTQPVDMGEYSDFNMLAPASGEPKAGVCHARGANQDIPAAWMIYIVVADLDASLAACRERGGEILGEPRSMGGASRYAFIRDPAGALCALYESA
ncbi:MAG: VOC family protein [Thermoanaerobaculia bacterium]